MLYHASDRYIQEYFIDSNYPAREHVAAVYDYLRETDENPIEMTQDELKQMLNLPIGSDGVGNCEQILEAAGVLERLIASQNMATVRIDSDLPTLVDLLPKQAKSQRKVLRAVEHIVGPRRQELVQFSVRDLSANDDMDQASIAHALHELNRLEAFTYVPAFRGRAIRMIRRDLSFDELEIDFEEIERRKAAEYEKLDRVIRFAMGGACRQQEILRYFGEENAERCGHCDNCRLHNFVVPGLAAASTRCVPDTEETAATEPAIDDNILRTVRIVLSGVARVQAKCSCGRNRIAEMLCGSRNAKLKKLGLDKLSTFGLLDHFKQDEVILIIDALMAMRCLQQVDVDRFRPVLELTEFGGEVMRGRATLPGELPLPSDLQWKLQSEQAGKQRDKERRRRGDEEISDSPTSSRLPVSPSPALPVFPSSHWTRRLLAAGFTVDECMAIRGLTREVILEHAREAEEEGGIEF
jgi:ATP-dependent DNA helicase RecQ